MKRSHYPTRIIRKGDPMPVDDERYLSPQERLDMVRILTERCYELMGERVDSRLPRHVVRVIRGGR